MPWVNYASPFGTLSAWVDDTNPIVNNVSNNAPEGFSVTQGSYVPGANVYQPPNNPAPSPSPPVDNTPVSQLVPVPRLQPSQATPVTTPVSTTPTTPTGGTPANPTPTPTPSPVATTRTVKVAEPDIIQFNGELVDSDILQQLVYNQIGGIELIATNRSDTINGENVVYNIITDLRIVSLQFNPTNILTDLRAQDYYFAQFPINIATRLPDNAKDVVTIGTVYNPNIFPITKSGIAMNFTLNYLNTGEQLEVDFLVAGSINSIGNNNL